MQSAKIIDITRSFVPVDPNTFPETLHGTTKEDYPEQRVPVIPYMGYNFLPTGPGYKSFFGMNSAIAIDSLSPNKPDSVFLFQSLTYKNILIALCDTGVWCLNTEVSTAWVQLVVTPAPADTAFYEWYSIIVKNKLYIFQNNKAAYHVIETDPMQTLGIKLTSVVPTFIDLTMQLGMTRLGGRLAFWDANNAVSWSSPDDLSIFTPDPLTGANVTTFNSITGRITHIVPHGKHAIAYASKSIVLLQVEPSDTFLVKAVPIMNGAGIAYKRQVVAGVPDTAHFCYTDIGIYKIENAKPDEIATEFYDYLKPYTGQPVYLRILQGRFLCFEILDINALNGVALFSKSVIPPSSLLFSTVPDTLDAVNAGTEHDVVMCDVVAAIPNDAFAEQKAASNAAVPPNLCKPGTSPQAIYTCYLSLANGPTEPITWGAVPCGTAPFTPSPNGNGGKLSQWSTDKTNKTAKTGTESWIDGKWTMERFVQYQTAIWTKQQQSMKNFIGQIVNRAESAQNNTALTYGCNSGNVVTDCTIGRYPTAFSAPQFGFNKCSFWLTRYALGASDIVNRDTKTTSCSSADLGDVLPVYYTHTYAGGEMGPYASMDAAVGAFGGAHDWAGQGPGPFSPLASQNSLGQSGLNNGSYPEAQSLEIGSYAPTGGPGGLICYIKAYWAASPVGVAKYTKTLGNPPVVGTRPAAGYFMTSTGHSYNNREVPVAPAVLGVETAYCEITGYEYTDTAGNKQVMPVAGGCTITADKYPSSTAPTRIVPSNANRNLLVDGTDGSMCGLPFDLTNSLLPDVKWTDQTLVYPGSTFLVQQGSIAPKYPTARGAFVYDLALKKWGKMRGDYKQLLDYSPINSGSAATVSFDTFGILAGAIRDNGLIYLFDDNPAESSITWGKIGYYRLGVTDLQAVRVDFVRPATGTIVVDTSLDGATLGTELTSSLVFNNAKTVTIYPEYSGKWHNVTITGRYNVALLETIGLHKGRR